MLVVADRLPLTNALAEAGIERLAAERIASVIFDAIHDNVATKADLQRVEANLQAELASIRAELALTEHRLLVRLGG
jgi:hypothetical protein